MRDEVTVHVEAPPEAVYGVLTDVARMGEWSPEVYRAAWVDGATGPAVGARFTAWNRRFGFLRYGNTSTVVVAEPGREFAFVQGSVARFRMKWTYRLTPAGTGTDLTESWETGPGLGTAGAKAALPPRRRSNLRRGMTQTVTGMKAAAEGTLPAS